VDRDNSVDTATRYGLDGPVEARFSAACVPTLEPT